MRGDEVTRGYPPSMGAEPEPLLLLNLDDHLPVGLAADAVSLVARSAGAPDDRAGRLSEVVGHLVADARAREEFAEAVTPVVVEVRRHGGTLLVRVSDRRLPVVTDEVADHPAWRHAGDVDVDSLRLSVGVDGNAVECRLALPPDPEWAATLAGPSDETPSVGPVDPETITVRRAAPADAAGIVRLTFRCYGYTYADPDMYVPRAVERLLRDGTQQSYVAVTPDGDVVAHASTTLTPGARVPEYGRLMVDRRFRGAGLGERVGHTALEQTRRAGAPGVWSECVANHPASQRAMLAAGGVETGLLLGAAPTSITMAGFSWPEHDRMSLVPMFAPLAPATAAPAYLPDHLGGAYRDVMATLGLPRDVRDVDQPAAGQAAVEVSVHAGLSSAVVSVSRYGADAGTLVAEHLRMFAGLGLAAVYLDLPLAAPHTPRAVRLAETLGFSWASLMPCARSDGDVLRLQRLTGPDPDTADLVIVSERGRRMAEFVRSERQRVLRAAERL